MPAPRRTADRISRAASTLNRNKRLNYFGGDSIGEPFSRPVVDQCRLLLRSDRGETAQAVADLRDALDGAPADWPMLKEAEQLLRQLQQK